MKFTKSAQVFIAELLAALGIRVDELESNDILYFDIDSNQRKMLMEKIYFAEVYSFNMENWYHHVRELEVKTGNSFTAATEFIPLTDCDLK